MEEFVDVLIVGAGVAGLYSALNLRDDLKIMVVCKGELTESNTYLAQGGISTARGIGDIKLFIEDTLKAGRYENNINSVKILANESMHNINNLLDLGLELDKDNEELLYTREGAHSINRIVHCKDFTGRAVADTLIKRVKERKNVQILENAYFGEIIHKDNTCVGGVILKDEKQINVFCKVLILASGGIGGVFKNSTNMRILTADGLAAAIRNNIKVQQLNYIQFHPTALYSKNNNNRKFLISEAVRGEGGKLVDCNGDRFINELLPRDVVTEAILKQMKKTTASCVYLDITFKSRDFIKNRFPTIFEECMKNNIDPSKDLIPVTPAQHYFMGGISVDSHAKTSMNNLYAVGEVSCTGVHGANRLASNSLLEGLVFSRRAAQKINSIVDNISIPRCEVPNLCKDIDCLVKENIKLVKHNIIIWGGKKLNDELFVS